MLNKKFSLLLALALALTLPLFFSGCVSGNATSVSDTAPIQVSQYNQLMAPSGYVGVTDGFGVLHYRRFADLNGLICDGNNFLQSPDGNSFSCGTPAIGGSSSLANLNDVNVSGVMDSNALVYNASTGKWVPGTATGGNVIVDFNIVRSVDENLVIPLLVDGNCLKVLGTSLVWGECGGGINYYLSPDGNVYSLGLLGDNNVWNIDLNTIGVLRAQGGYICDSVNCYAISDLNASTDISLAGEQDFFFYKQASGVSDYNLMKTDFNAGAEQTITLSGATNGSTIVSFLNPDFNATVLKNGTFEIHLHASTTASGTKIVRLYGEVYKRTLAGSETLLLTTENSNTLTGAEEEYTFHGELLNAVGFNQTDYLVAKIKANISGAGSNPSISVFVDGTTTSHLGIPSVIDKNYLDTIYARLNSSNQPFTGDLYVNGSFGLGTTEPGELAEFRKILDNALLRFHVPGISEFKIGIDTLITEEGGTGIFRIAPTPSNLAIEDTVAGLTMLFENGFVGINTTTPQNMLEVAGDINASGSNGNIYADQNVSAKCFIMGDNNSICSRTDLGTLDDNDSNFVPYVGADKDVNIGNNSFATKNLQVNGIARISGAQTGTGNPNGLYITQTPSGSFNLAGNYFEFVTYAYKTVSGNRVYSAGSTGNGFRDNLGGINTFEILDAGSGYSIGNYVMVGGGNWDAEMIVTSVGTTLGEILTTSTGSSQGTNYVEGELINIDFQSQDAQIRVTGIGAGGSVSTWEWVTRGSYYDTGNDCQTFSNGSGTGFLINIDSVGIGDITGLEINQPGTGYSANEEDQLYGNSENAVIKIDSIYDSGTYDLNVNWNSVPNADGYRVLIYDEVNGFNYDRSIDVSTNNLIYDGTGTSTNITVTPSSIQLGATIMGAVGILTENPEASLDNTGTTILRDKLTVKKYGGATSPNADPNAMVVYDSGSNATNVWYNMSPGATNSTFGFTIGSNYKHGVTYNVAGNYMILTDDGANSTPGTGVVIDSHGRCGIWETQPTALLSLAPSSGSAGYAPLKFRSGNLLSSPEVGAWEFNGNDFYATITSGAARKGIVLNDGANLTSTRIPFATTNGRLTDSANLTWDGGKVTINSNTSGISLWVDANVSATGYITRSEVYDKNKGSALSQIKDASAYLVGKDINHSAFGYSSVNYQKSVLDKVVITKQDQNVLIKTIKHYWNLSGKEITEKEALDLAKTAPDRYTTTNEEIWKIIQVDVNTPIYKNITEEGVSLDKEVALLKQALFEIKDCAAKNKDWESYQKCVEG